MSTLTVVAGPPCSGKTHHVLVHARPDDLVLDADDIGQRRWRQAVAELERRSGLHQDVWVIRSLAGRARRAEFVERLRADELVLLWPDTDVLMARARRRPHPARHITAIRAWLADEASGADLVEGDPQPKPRTSW